MASAPKKKVQDINGDQFFPITHVNAVINDDGDTLDVLMSTDVKQVNIGATPYTPTVGVVTLPSYPSAPGTLNTNNSTAQTASNSEALSGTIKLHKVSKTGTYSDLIGTPTIPSAPGTLVTNKTTAQTASAGEAMSGTINLHKIAKTGTYSDLIGTPTLGTMAAESASSYVQKSGDTMSGALTMSNGASNGINIKDTGGTARDTIHIDGSNVLEIGYATAGAGYSTYLDGNGIFFRYGTARSVGMMMNTYGNLTLGSSSLAGTQNKLYVNGKTYVDGNIDATGTITPGSDSRVKDNQQEIDGNAAMEIIARLTPKTWTWCEKTPNAGKKAAGLVAQEVAEVIPEAVLVGEGCGLEDFHSLNYNTVQGYEIAAIKGLITEVRELRAEIDELKKR